MICADVFTSACPWWFPQLIKDLREAHDASGSKTNFIVHLHDMGIEMVGMVCLLEDKWATYAELRYAA